jgi:hypothetical protein
MSEDIFKESWLLYGPDAPKQCDTYIAVDPAGFEEVKDQTKKKHLDNTAIAVVKVDDLGKWFVQKVEYGRWDVQQFSADGNEVIKTLGTYDTREQAQKAIRANRRQAAPSGLIFPFKDDEEGFKKRLQAVQDEALRKAGVDVDANKPKVKALESIANSASNFLNRVEGTYPRINILADDLLESTLGRTAANFIRYTDPREGGDGLSIEQRRAKNYKILDELAAKIKPVNEFTDVVPAGDIAGIAA